MIAQDTAAETPSTRLRSPSLIRAANGMCLVVALAILLTLGVLAWVWLSPDRVATLVAGRLGLSDVRLSLDAMSRGLGFAVSMIPLAALFYALAQVHRLCGGIREGYVRWEQLAFRLNRLAWAMGAIAVLRPLTNALLSIVLTVANAPDQRHVVLAFSTDDYIIALLGGLIFILGRVMREAGSVALENQQII